MMSIWGTFWLVNEVKGRRSNQMKIFWCERDFSESCPVCVRTIGIYCIINSKTSSNSVIHGGKFNLLFLVLHFILLTMLLNWIYYVVQGCYGNDLINVYLPLSSIICINIGIGVGILPITGWGMGCRKGNWIDLVFVSYIFHTHPISNLYDAHQLFYSVFSLLIFCPLDFRDACSEQPVWYPSMLLQRIFAAYILLTIVRLIINYWHVFNPGAEKRLFMVMIIHCKCLLNTQCSLWTNFIYCLFVYFQKSDERKLPKCKI